MATGGAYLWRAFAVPRAFLVGSSRQTHLARARASASCKGKGKSAICMNGFSPCRSPCVCRGRWLLPYPSVTRPFMFMPPSMPPCQSKTKRHQRHRAIVFVPSSCLSRQYSGGWHARHSSGWQPSAVFFYVSPRLEPVLTAVLWRLCTGANFKICPACTASHCT